MKSKSKRIVVIPTFQPIYKKIYKTQLERDHALISVMSVDHMVFELEKLIKEKLKEVAEDRQKLRKEGFLV